MCIYYRIYFVLKLLSLGKCSNWKRFRLNLFVFFSYNWSVNEIQGCSKKFYLNFPIEMCNKKPRNRSILVCFFFFLNENEEINCSSSEIKKFFDFCIVHRNQMSTRFGIKLLNHYKKCLHLWNVRWKNWYFIPLRCKLFPNERFGKVKIFRKHFSSIRRIFSLGSNYFLSTNA